MKIDDGPALAAYRNDPVIARYQDWELPFTLDDAVRFIGAMAADEWPVLGDWHQVAIDLDGDMIGDVGVHRSADGSEATIGYTVADDHQGRGYATEAVSAIVRLLIDEGAVRVVASIDPANVASRRVLERVGFRFEHRTHVVVRGETVDDDRYVLTSDA